MIIEPSPSPVLSTTFFSGTFSRFTCRDILLLLLKKVYRAKQSRIKIRNPKHEIRNKPEPNKSKPGKAKTSNPIWARFEFVAFGSFEFVSDFVLRASSFCRFAR